MSKKLLSFKNRRSFSDPLLRRSRRMTASRTSVRYAVSASERRASYTRMELFEEISQLLLVAVEVLPLNQVLPRRMGSDEPCADLLF